MKSLTGLPAWITRDLMGNHEDCPEGQLYDDDVGGCVPESPDPFQEITVGETKWIWKPDEERWRKAANPGTGGDASRKRVVGWRDEDEDLF